MLTLKRKPLLPLPTAERHPAPSIALLPTQLLRWSLFNLLLVATVGVLMRALPFINGFPFAYKNVLHGHSHFAFGGWVMPLLLALIVRAFPALANAVAFCHWRNISVLLMASAYGMLLAFPLLGYKPLSIFFATLSIFAGYYLAWVVFKAGRQLPATPGMRLLRAGLLYLTLASLGPFATGPLVALGYSETPLYFNAIYGYLHFTYNGFFTFALLAVVYQTMGQHGAGRYGHLVCRLMHAACVPAYALSVLWTAPALVYYVIGGIAAALQLVATLLLLLDAGRLQWLDKSARWLMVIALFAFVLKHLLQAASAFPTVAAMAASGRGFVIAYLHLVLLGFVSMGALAMVVQHRILRCTKSMRHGLYIFLAGFVATELLLVSAGMHHIAPHYTALLLLAALVMLAGLGVLKTGSGQQPGESFLNARGNNVEALSAFDGAHRQQPYANQQN